MSDLRHLFQVGQKVKYRDDDIGKVFPGIVRETYEDYIIVDIPKICDHMWFEREFNLDRLYPDYNPI